MTRFKKNMRRFVVAAVVGAMAMSMTACTSHMFDEKTITGTIKDNADNYTKVQKDHHNGHTNQNSQTKNERGNIFFSI